MKIINWAKLSFKKTLKDAWEHRNPGDDLIESDKLEILFERPEVKILTLKKVKRIASLEDEVSIASILKVYASAKFNDEYVDYLLSKDDKDRIVEILFESKGKTQFNEACKVFLHMSPRNLMGKTDSIEKATSYVANANHKFQASFAGCVAVDPFFQRHDNFISIVQVLSVLDKDNIREFMGDILSARESEDTRTASISIKKSLLKYAKLMSIDIEDSGIGEGDSSMGTHHIIRKRKDKRGRR